MNEFMEIKPEELTKNPFHMIGKEWMLITAGNQEKVNTMTASWGELGIMWNKNVVTVVLRPQRYTKEFVDAGEHFSLSFFGNEHKKELGYLGKVSGRDENKIEKSGLKVTFKDDIPFFQEAKTVILCKKLFAQEMKPESFIDTSLLGINYPNKDYHTMYIAEIEKILVAKQ